VIDVRTAAARERLLASLGVPRWVDEVAADGPFPTVAALVAAALTAGVGLTEDELTEAAARIGAADAADRAVEGLGRADEGDDAAIARGSEVYEQRFGRAFLIRADGRTRQEVLDELQRRLKNDPADETAEAKQELLAIATQRLTALFGDAG
jgi:2-oxo-4-hydroxy-4-carboxy-5-ureidoimidazoline decarboxylase